MRKYEIMFIVRPDLEENAVKETVKKLEKTLTDMLRGTVGAPALDGSVKVADLVNDAKAIVKQ